MQKNTQWTDVIYFVEKFKAILEYVNVEINRLYEEFCDYKTFGNNTIPQEVFSEAKINEKEYRIDVLWKHLAHMRQDGICDNFRFHLLFNVARLYSLLRILMRPLSEYTRWYTIGYFCG